jgi:hypothetical protein
MEFKKKHFPLSDPVHTQQKDTKNITIIII